MDKTKYALNIFTDWMAAHPIMSFVFIISIFILKGLALWKSAEREQKAWFIVLLVINTFGILELVYLFFVAPRTKVELINA